MVFVPGEEPGRGTMGRGAGALEAEVGSPKANALAVGEGLAIKNDLPHLLGVPGQAHGPACSSCSQLIARGPLGSSFGETEEEKGLCPAAGSDSWSSQAGLKGFVT